MGNAGSKPATFLFSRYYIFFTSVIFKFYNETNNFYLTKGLEIMSDKELAKVGIMIANSMALYASLGTDDVMEFKEKSRELMLMALRHMNTENLIRFEKWLETENLNEEVIL